jgi:signal transduction histidine kinase
LAPFDFDEMVREAVDTFRILHPEFFISIHGMAGKKIKADRYRILQVITNYLTNAVKYSNGQLKIKIIITVSATQLQLAVEDNGVGISLEQMPFLFDRFFRAEKTRSLEGIGLGLYLCRRIIHAHGGKCGPAVKTDWVLFFILACHCFR